MRILSTLFALAMLTGAAVATTHHVPSDFSSVQAAIDAAVTGDTVLVAPGTYAEAIDFHGKGIAVLASGGPELTVLQGFGYALPQSVVTFASGEGPDALLEGFTITGGWAYDGGGIHCEQSSPTIRGNHITGNFAGDFDVTGRGAGLFARLGAPRIEGNLIEGNLAGSHYGGTYGGGVYCDEGEPVILGNVIRGNRANYGGGVYQRGAGEVRANTIEGNHGNFGGGLACISSTARIADNRILGNTILSSSTFGSGGGIYVDSGAPTIDGNVIRGNQTFGSGGGIHVNANASPLIVNDTIVSNSGDFFGPSRGGGLFVGHDCVVLVVNTILWGNYATQGEQACVANNPYPATLQMRASDVQGGAAAIVVEAGSTLDWGAGMLDADPAFEDDHLRYRSPCMNAGSAGDVISATDFEGDPRVAFGVVDMGADEFHRHLYHTGAATPGGVVTVKLVGLPGTQPVLLFVGTGLLGAPIPTKAGPFFLASPLILLGPFGPQPASGVRSVSATLPLVLPLPLDLPLQALLGTALSNLDVIEVR